MLSLALNVLGRITALATPRNLAALLVIFAITQTVRIGHIKHELATARADLRVSQASGKSFKAALTRCEKSRATVTAALNDQNKAVDRQKALTAETLALSAKAASDARAVAASARHEADLILSQHLTGASACERAEDARRKYLEGLR